MWELDHKEGCTPKNWCFWTVVLEKTLESHLDHKEIQPVNHKGNQSWIFIGRTDAKTESPIVWLPDAKSWLIRKDSDAGKDWRQEEMGLTEDEMVGWNPRPSWTWVWASSRRWWRTENLASWVSGITKSWTQLSAWTSTIYILTYNNFSFTKIFPINKDRLIDCQIIPIEVKF